MANNAFGIDLGTNNIKIYNRNDDNIMIEKNMIAIENKNTLFAYGNSAFEMYEKAPSNIHISYPLSNGVIADIKNMETLVKYFIGDLQKGNTKPSDFFIAVPTDVNEVEKRAFYDLIKGANVKAKKIMVVEKAVADGLGLDIDVKNSQGVLVVNVGYETTEISILSLGGIVLSRLIKVGGMKFDDAIRAAVRREFSLIIGGKTAENVKIALKELEEEGKGALVYGRDIVTGLPVEREIPTRMVDESLEEHFNTIIDNVKVILERRDETDLNGLKLTLDLKRGVDADKLMAKLFKVTPLEDSFSANFNILVSGQPRVMGVREILKEWTAFRVECVRRRTYYDLHGKEKRLHLLKGLAAILLDIDKAIKIIRTTEEETEVVPNLMIGFGIDEVQADYVAEIKLRHLNREYILKRTSEIEQLEKDIADLNDILAKPARIRRIIINELNDVAKKYGQPRRSEILYDLPEDENGSEEEEVPDYPVTVFFTREGYFKKIPPQGLRTAGAHKLKEGDEIVQQIETRNNVEALFFTDRQQVYKVRLAELEDGKVAQMGIFIPGRLGMDEGENVLSMVITSDYSGYMLFFFASGRCAKIPLSSYATKQNRRKLLKAYCDKEPLATLLFLPEETELAIRTSASRMLLVGTAQIAAKATRDSQGVAVVTLKKNQTIASVVPADTLELANPHRYRVRSLPATGALIRAEDEGEQMSLL